MKFIVISNPTELINEQEILCSLFEAGLEYYHLRKPEFEINEMEFFLKMIPEKYYERIVLHSHHELTKKYNLKGCHNSPLERGLRGVSKHVSTSFHSLKELKDCKEKYAYVFLSPIFDSISKQNYRSGFNKEELKEFLKNNNTEIIALGGVDENTIQDAIEMGFDGVAVLGAIWLSKDPLKKFVALQKSLEAISTNKRAIHA
jgi:thiamine-phosphate pyrophosphorylase